MYGFHSLTYAAGRYPSIKFFAAAKASGCDISAPNKCHSAAACVIFQCLEAASLALTYRYGSTALHAACLMENRDIVSLLVKLGADASAVDAAGGAP